MATTLASIKEDTRRATLAAQTAGVAFDPDKPVAGRVAVIHGEILKTAAIHTMEPCSAGQNGPGNLYSIDEIAQGNGQGQDIVDGVLELNQEQIDAMLDQGWHLCHGPQCAKARRDTTL